MSENNVWFDDWDEYCEFGREDELIENTTE